MVAVLQRGGGRWSDLDPRLATPLPYSRPISHGGLLESTSHHEDARDGGPGFGGGGRLLRRRCSAGFVAGLVDLNPSSSPGCKAGRHGSIAVFLCLFAGNRPVVRGLLARSNKGGLALQFFERHVHLLHAGLWILPPPSSGLPLSDFCSLAQDATGYLERNRCGRAEPSWARHEASSFSRYHGTPMCVVEVEKVVAVIGG